MFTFLICVYIGFCLLVSLMGINRSIGAVALFLLSFILTPIVGFIIALLYPTVNEPIDDDIKIVEEKVGENKVCPMCAEEVKSSARICKHCRHEFEELT